MKDEAA